MGLLGNSMDDPQTQGILALAAGLMHGDAGGGLLGYGQAYQGAQEGALKRQMTQAQLQHLGMQQQLEQYQLKRLQNWDQMVNGGGASAPQPSPDQITSPGAFMPSADGRGPVAPLDQAPASLTQPGWEFGLPGRNDRQSKTVAASMTPDAYMKLYAEQTAPQTDVTKLLAAQGIDPKSPIGQQAIQQALAKANYIAPVNARPGSILRDPRDPSKIIAFNPHIPEGTGPQFDGQGNVTAFQPIGNAEAAIGLSERAKTFGKAQATPSVAYGPDGRSVFRTVAQDIQQAGGAGFNPAGATGGLPPAQAGVQGAFQGDPAQAMEQVLSIKDPQERANAMAALSQQIRQQGGSGDLSPQQRPGVVQGATLSQDELSKKGSALMADNGNTNTVISRLQNIKMLAPGAVTGAESGRRDFFNGLLSLAGIKGAEDAKTASDLVDKNASQIVSALRLGAGGGGTDALQTLLGAANPNRHMTKEAMLDAADQLIASQKMIQDKSKLLNQHYLGRDPVTYGTKELAFDQNADPRVWQLQSMQPAQQAAYVKTLPADVAADLLKKRQALKQLGVF